MAFRYGGFHDSLHASSFQNFLQFSTHMLVIQMGSIPNLHGYFTFLMDNHLVKPCIIISLFASSMQTSSGFMIALNRLLSILKRNRMANIFFKTSCACSIIPPILVTAPVFLTYSYYDPVQSPTGQTHYVPVVVNM
ncbi:hypothetical protein PMAYCL1PPCAC_16047, partial [Pristionchus mayeri]